MVTAKLLPYRNAPTIHINGLPVQPSMLFGRLDMVKPDFLDAYHRELRRGARSGVHIHTMFLYMDADLTLPAEQSNAENRRMLRELLDIDPEGWLLPRCLVPYDHLITHTPESENERFTDGVGRPGEDYIRADFVSDVWREQALRLLTRFIRSILADERLCEHVIGYHFSGGETGEWFQRRYWDGVLNVSDANTRAFRRWLSRKYADDAALSAAWECEASLETAVVPADLPGYRHEFHPVGLLEGRGARRFIDYLDYFSDEVSDLIAQAAAVVKRETGGNSLFVSFYGYHFEVPGAYSGHNRLFKLLQCPDVDILTSPVSYINRNEGGMGAYMNEAASVLAAGKLWLDESDYRMPVITVQNPRDDFIPYVADLDAAREVILREYGKLALIGAGTWWMDLFNTGWFDDDTMWVHIAEGRGYYDQMRAAAVPAVPEVCYLIDEKAMAMVGDTWTFALDLMGRTRNEAYFTGLSHELRLLEDFLEGKLDGAKTYVFVNPFRLHDRDMAAIRARLQKNGATALWMFGFGLCADRAALRTLTGFDLEITPENADRLDALGVSIPRTAVSPLTVPLNGEVLGRYADGRAAFAVTDAGGYTSYFCGGSYVDPDTLRYVAEKSGARLYAAQGDVFNRRGNLAMFHTASAGEKTVDFGCPAVELRSGRSYQDGVCRLQAKRGETFLFILAPDEK